MTMVMIWRKNRFPKPNIDTRWFYHSIATSDLPLRWQQVKLNSYMATTAKHLSLSQSTLYFQALFSAANKYASITRTQSRAHDASVLLLSLYMGSITCINSSFRDQLMIHRRIEIIIKKRFFRYYNGEKHFRQWLYTLGKKGTLSAEYQELQQECDKWSFLGVFLTVQSESRQWWTLSRLYVRLYGISCRCALTELESTIWKTNLCYWRGVRIPQQPHKG